MTVERKEQVVVTKDRGYQRQDRVVEYERPATQVFISRLQQFIGFCVVIINLLLIARFALRLIAANAANPVVNFVYAVTNPFADPFQTIVGNVTFSNGGVIDYGSLFALVTFTILGWIVITLIGILFRSAGGTRHVTTYEEKRG